MLKLRRKKKLLLRLAGDKESASSGKAKHEVPWDNISVITIEPYGSNWLIKFITKDEVLYYHPGAFSSYDLALIFLMQNYARLLGGA